LAQDDYYYEIQLTNKQLVFYFMAGAAGLILSFLAGVMVGRGVDTAAVADGQARRVVEQPVVSEEPVATPAPEYRYPQQLESDHPDAALERPRPAAVTTPAATPTPAPTPAPVASTPRPTPAPTPAPTPKATPAPTPKATPAPSRPSALPNPLPSVTAAGHAVQVGAFKDKASADSVTNGLKKKGIPAYVIPPAPGSGGLFTVRVGPYRDRADAEVVAERLRAEKFKPYIIKQ
jgi:cell division protein FtsN